MTDDEYRPLKICSTCGRIVRTQEEWIDMDCWRCCAIQAVVVLLLAAAMFGL